MWGCNTNYFVFLQRTTVAWLVYNGQNLSILYPPTSPLFTTLIMLLQTQFNSHIDKLMVCRVDSIQCMMWSDDLLLRPTKLANMGSWRWLDCIFAGIHSLPLLWCVINRFVAIWPYFQPFISPHVEFALIFASGYWYSIHSTHLRYYLNVTCMLQLTIMQWTEVGAEMQLRWTPLSGLGL